MTSYYERLTPRELVWESKEYELEEGTTALQFIETVQAAILADVPSDKQKTCTFSYHAESGWGTTWTLRWEVPESEERYRYRWEKARSKVEDRCYVRRRHNDGKLRSIRYELSRSVGQRHEEIERWIQHIEQSFVQNLMPIPADDSPLPPLGTRRVRV